MPRRRAVDAGFVLSGIGNDLSACGCLLGGLLNSLSKGLGLSASFVFSRCFATSSPIFALRRDFGMRLMRSSMRVRRLCACNAYCALNFRARSVTELQSVAPFKTISEESVFTF